MAKESPTPLADEKGESVYITDSSSACSPDRNIDMHINSVTRERLVSDAHVVYGTTADETSGKSMKLFPKLFFLILHYHRP